MKPKQQPIKLADLQEAIKKRHDEAAAERAKMTDEEYQRILDANYRGHD
jgi:hypothetical protein